MGTLSKERKRKKDENYQGYIWLRIKTLTEPNFISFHSLSYMVFVQACVIF